MDFIEHLDGSVVVSDAAGKIIYRNEKAFQTFVKPGEPDLTGRDLMACHNENSQAIIRRIIETGEKNVYTIEKNGVKKLIYQTPWIENGEFKGLVELSLEIPFEMPHFVRKGI